MSMEFREKITALREQIYREGLDGFIIPRADEFQGEFVAPYAERLKWLTGFSGSAGVAIVLQGKAVVLSDGRYTIQLRQQVDLNIFAVGDSVVINPGVWLAANAKAGAKIGFDPWLHTLEQIKKLQEACAEKKIRLVPLAHNLIDAIWTDQPAKPCGAAEIFPQEIAGCSVTQKKAAVARALAEAGVLAAVIAMPDSVSWLLNVRGDDVGCLPVVLSYALVYADDRPVHWLVDPAKIGVAVVQHIQGAAQIVSSDAQAQIFTALIDEAKQKSKPVAVDFNAAPTIFKTALEAGGAQVMDLKDPCVGLRAIKTAQEQAAIKAAHIKDGAALAQFLCWLDQHSGSGTLTEIAVEEKLLQCRAVDPAFRGPSFETIAGFAENGAIVHYRASAATNKTLAPGNLLLLDSGGQYEWGTTDITRTIAIGAPSQEMREHFTLVLKGHIALARAEFPEGTLGAQVDLFARAPLQERGLDYAHGTGHGVGCYLSVHEEAAGISPRGKTPLQTGMLLSNEPGYYKEGAYGIRIENLVLVKSVGAGMLGFETVSLVPIDRRLIVKEMLTAQECAWLNEYHLRVFSTIASLVDTQTRAWLEKNTFSL